MTVLDITEVREAVDKGVALLDEHAPDWRSRVDGRRLHMDCAHSCVLGQAFDDGPFAVESGWSKGLSELGLRCAASLDDTLTLAAEYGFSLPPSMLRQAGGPSTHEREQEWAALTAEWLRRLP